MKIEELASVERELRRTRRAGRARDERARGRAAEQRRNRSARTSKRAWCELYKLGRAGYWRLLLDVDDLRAIGRAYRTAAALNRLDRDRVQEHRADARRRSRRSAQALEAQRPGR